MCLLRSRPKVRSFRSQRPLCPPQADRSITKSTVYSTLAFTQSPASKYRPNPSTASYFGIYTSSATRFHCGLQQGAGVRSSKQSPVPMADEWWSSERPEDTVSACSTVRVTDQDAAESAATSAVSTDFRPSLHVDAAGSPSSFLAYPIHMDWTQAYMGGGRAAAEATAGFNALLQLHGDDAARHFLLDQQPDSVDGAGPVAPPAAASRNASLQYADNQYSSYGGVQAAPMTKPLSQQHHSGFFGSSSTRNFSDMPSVPPMTTTKPLLLQASDSEHKAFKSHKVEPGQDACSSATRRSVPDSRPPAAAAKKPRNAMPSPLPTFKVRKEKLGDRITALQQLVSPFGKTDTASVLHEAIEYIRFLHDQVASLSSPYLRCGRPVQQLQQQQAMDGGETKEDLRSRELCLVPVASTYAVAGETAPDLWHPTFGGTFR